MECAAQVLSGGKLQMRYRCTVDIAEGDFDHRVGLDFVGHIFDVAGDARQMLPRLGNLTV